jgi:hypothetical protein
MLFRLLDRDLTARTATDSPTQIGRPTPSAPLAYKIFSTSLHYPRAHDMSTWWCIPQD